MNYSLIHGSSLNRLVLSHPFTQQIDVLISPPNQTLEEDLQQIRSDYHSGRVELSEILDACHQDLIGRFDDTTIDFIALAEGHPGVEDVWCIDHRGLLTLLLTKETYQQLGLTGERASKKSDLHYVQVDLHDRTSSTYTRARERIQLWDERRKAQGVLPRSVRFHGDLTSLQTKLQSIKVDTKPTALDNIHVPILDETKDNFSLARSRNKNGGLENEDEEEVNERIEELFEWVGMACMNSDRLKANDRPNSFVAQYEAPQPSRIGSATHIRWGPGFFAPSFAKQVLETAATSIKAVSNSQGDLTPAKHSFLSVTANLHRNAPISYISPKAFGEGVKREVKMGRWDRKVACWSLILKPFAVGNGKSGGQNSENAGEGSEDNKECEWILACAQS